MLVLKDCHNKIPYIECPDLPGNHSLTYWRLEVHDQDIGRFGVSKVFSLTCRWPPSGHVLRYKGLSFICSYSWCLYVCPNFLLLPGHQSDWFRAHSNGLIFILITFSMSLCPNTVPFLNTKGVSVSTCKFWGNII